MLNLLSCIKILLYMSVYMYKQSTDYHQNKTKFLQVQKQNINQLCLQYNTSYKTA